MSTHMTQTAKQNARPGQKAANESTATPPAMRPAALDSDPTQALQALIKITQALVDFADREHQALTKNDMLDFAIMQDEKAVLTERYVAMSREFRNRLEEFRGRDIGLLDRLENLQKELSEKSQQNNDVINNVQTRARQKTSSTLFSAQELGQSHSLTFVQDLAQRADEKNNATQEQK